MKDEIKKIFDTKLYFDLDDEDYTKIQDYITNLQEENKNRISESLSYDLAKARIKELEYRIDKAIEYINTIKNNTPSSNRKDFAKLILINYERLLNTLQGDDKE